MISSNPLAGKSFRRNGFHFIDVELLHITPSALSRRIASLERVTGRILIHRGRPCTPTRDGRILLGLARETTIMLDLHIDDESRTAEKLSDGTVMAAVSTSSTAVPGTHVSPLGVLRYLPVAASTLGADLNPATTPMVRFDVRDDLQHAYLRAIGCATTPPAHHVPATHEFATAVRAGLGWGMLTEQEAADGLESGSLIVLKNPHPVDLQLHWHRWRTSSPTLDVVSHHVESAAHPLHPSKPPGGAESFV